LANLGIHLLWMKHLLKSGTSDELAWAYHSSLLLLSFGHSSNTSLGFQSGLPIASGLTREAPSLSIGRHSPSVPDQLLEVV
jgi:hypothetical protein